MEAESLKANCELQITNKVWKMTRMKSLLLLAFSSDQADLLGEDIFQNSNENLNLENYKDSEFLSQNVN